MDNKEILNFFPQTVFKYKVNNFREYNDKLSEYIYNLQREDKNGIQSNNNI